METGRIGCPDTRNHPQNLTTYDRGDGCIGVKWCRNPPLTPMDQRQRTVQVGTCEQVRGTQGWIPGCRGPRKKGTESPWLGRNPERQDSNAHPCAGHSAAGRLSFGSRLQGIPAYREAGRRPTICPTLDARVSCPSNHQQALATEEAQQMSLLS